jgi:hypothetical protein
LPSSRHDVRAARDDQREIRRMKDTLFKKVDYNLTKLIHDIRIGEIGLPDIQRPFVWKTSKVRDLFDSMYRGYPVGYFLFWQATTQAASDGYRKIGLDDKQHPPRLLIVDGQQRLTSLYAVLTGTPVVRDDYRNERLQIAFRPTDQVFEVADATVKNDPEFIADISQLWSGEEPYGRFVRAFLERLRSRREVDQEEEYDLEEIIDRLRDLQGYPFTALELSSDVDEEQVAEVFVRINSAGTLLSQADFILTLMSVFWDKGRRALEEFARDSRQPSDSGASPYNHFLQPEPDQMLRVSVALAFRRARLQFVYSILRGKDLKTGEFSSERRDAQFASLADAQGLVLDVQAWQDFLKVLIRAGYRSGAQVTSKMGLIYTYAIYLIGRRDYEVDSHRLRNVIARWFFMTSLTGRYTNSPETVMEQDLARLREVEDADSFVKLLDGIIKETLTGDYWTITLPGALATTGAYSPTLFAHYAALNILDARLLFSNLKVSELLDPATKGKRSAIERHHLFPKGYLSKIGVKGGKQNRIANLALVEWPDNAKISDEAPADYWPAMRARFDEAELKPMLYWHGLPDHWETMEYDEFLTERQRGIAGVIRDGFTRLWEDRAPAEAEAEQLLTKHANETRRAPTEELIAGGEGTFVEFKVSARWSHIQGLKEKESEVEVIRTLAGFLNAKGGTLLIGVHDTDGAIGLARDYKSLQKRPNRDGFENWLTTDVIRLRLGAQVMPHLRVAFESVGGSEICRVDAEPSPEPVYVDGKRFFLRVNNTTQELGLADAVAYVKRRWPGR